MIEAYRPGPNLLPPGMAGSMVLAIRTPARPPCATLLPLLFEVLVKEFSHHLQTILRLRKIEVVPERVRHGFVDEQAGVDSRVHQSEVEDGGVAEQRVAG